MTESLEQDHFHPGVLKDKDYKWIRTTVESHDEFTWLFDKIQQEFEYDATNTLKEVIQKACSVLNELKNKSYPEILSSCGNGTCYTYALQILLASQGAYGKNKKVIDGVLWPQTKKATKQFQTAYNTWKYGKSPSECLTEDGLAWPKTIQALLSVTQTSTTISSPNSNTPPQTPEIATDTSKSATTPSPKDSTKIADTPDAATPSSKQSGSVDKSKIEEARNKKICDALDYDHLFGSNEGKEIDLDAVMKICKDTYISGDNYTISDFKQRSWLFHTMNVAEHAYLDQVSISKDEQGDRIMTFDIHEPGAIRRPQYKEKTFTWLKICLQDILEANGTCDTTHKWKIHTALAKVFFEQFINDDSNTDQIS
jgi:peptidoglycan hydrolase-like protein with peptidoglycan-binding domain